MAKRVLVVDDEMDMRTFYTTLLETSGYKPLSAVDGKLCRRPKGRPGDCPSKKACSHHTRHYDAKGEWNQYV